MKRLAATLVPSLIPVLLAGALHVPCDGTRTTASGFHHDGALAPFHASMSVSCKDDMLHVTVSRDLDTGEQPESAGGNDNPAMFAKDVVEITLSPRPKSGIYYHIGINPEGKAYSARCRDISWNPDLSVTSNITGVRWTVDVDIPYADLGVEKPRKGDVWRFNAGIARTSGRAAAVSWSGAVNYHAIAQMGELAFGETERGPHVERMYVERNRTLVVEVNGDGGHDQIMLRHAGEIYTSIGGLNSRISLDDKYQPVKRRFEPVEIILPGQPEIKRCATIYPDFKLELGLIYATQLDKDIDVKHDFPSPAKFTLFSGDEAIMHMDDFPREGKLGISSLPVGDYRVEISSGNHRADRFFRKLPKLVQPPTIAKESKLKPSGDRLQLDGHPVFLLGASQAPKTHTRFFCAFNLGCGNCGTIAGAPGIAGSRGKKFTRNGHEFPAGFEKEFEKQMSEQRGHDIVRLAYEAQMPILGEDGKPNGTDKGEFYGKLYATAKRISPETTISIHTDTTGLLDSFSKCSDVIEYAAWTSSYSPDMMQEIDRDLAELKVNLKGKPAIFWIGGSVPDCRIRTAEELRAATFLAAMHGMSGVVVHMGHGGIPEHMTRLWSLLSGISYDVQPFFEKFATGEKLDGFVESASRQCRVMATKNGDKVILAAVDLSGTGRIVEIHTAYGDIREYFTPYEPKVFELTAPTD
ncbi:MAG: hypothetical protein MJ025_01375 [Victivallaceae bacterium]|nr:hypothetical protein [Victivallaceae bacterium]